MYSVIGATCQFQRFKHCLTKSFQNCNCNLLNNFSIICVKIVLKQEPFGNKENYHDSKNYPPILKDNFHSGYLTVQ